MFFHNEEDSGLTPVTRPASSANRKKIFKKVSAAANASSSATSSCCTAVWLLLAFVCIASVSLLFHKQLQSLTVQLHADETAMAALQSKVKQQQTVIDRFSTAVTNQDVVVRVDALQNALDSQMLQVQQELNATQSDIANKLDSTLQQMTLTVTQAETQITNQVNSIQSTLEQYVRTTQDQFSMENSFMVYQLAGTFTLLACLITMWHVGAHVRRFARPLVQRKILAILWMSPIYSVTSWLSLVFPPFHEYLALIKDCYEAYVIYQFLGFLIAVLGGPHGDRHTVVDLLAKHAHHLEPPITLNCCCSCLRKHKYNKEYWDSCSPTVLADQVLMQCQIFAMQFVFLKPLTVIALFILNKLQYYGPVPGVVSARDYKSLQFWIVLLENASVFMAFSGLLKFYHAVQENLEWCRPFPKFLCIKGIVFMTFWQGLVISILANSAILGGVAPPGTTHTNNDDPTLWGQQAQNFLICLEMLFFSIAHFNCFPTDEWQDDYQPRHKDKEIRFGDTIALRDFMDDVKLILKKGNNSASSSTTSSSSSSSSSYSHLAKLEEKYQGILSSSMNTTTPTTTTSSSSSSSSSYRTHNTSLHHRTSRKNAASTVESLALFSPQLVLLQEEEEDDDDEDNNNDDDDHNSQICDLENNILQHVVESESIIDTNSSMEVLETTHGIDEIVLGISSNENETLINDVNSLGKDRRDLEEERTRTYAQTQLPNSSSYYGTPIFVDPPLPPPSTNYDYGSNNSTIMGPSIGHVSWGQFENNPDETTRLLDKPSSGSSGDKGLTSRKSDEFLRPSIFTTLGGLGAHNKFT